MSGHVSGLNRVLKRLNDEVRAIEGRTEAGLIKASIVVRRRMEKSTPKIPVDLGNLRSSWFVVTHDGKVNQGKSPRFRGDESSVLKSQHGTTVTANRAYAKAVSESNGGGPALAVGFTAFYAWYVHEMIGATFGRSGAGAGFFRSAVNRGRREMLKAIQDEAKI